MLRFGVRIATRTTCKSAHTTRTMSDNTFNIQPRACRRPGVLTTDPATTNDPSTDPAIQGSHNPQLTSNNPTRGGENEVYAQPGPHVASSDQWKNVEAPKSSAELDARAKELNQ